ncbi:MAG: alpha/beta hydrolase [Sphingomonadales bacterium]|nr:MAG: alpha/beta hydrolase [Sphingomonadales bacterium]
MRGLGAAAALLALATLGGGAAVPPAAAQAASAERLAPGTGSFTFTGWAGKPLPIFYYLPEKVDANTRILFVFHGMGRNASGYRDDWVEFAKAGNFIVATPHFTDADYPGSRTYNLGNIADSKGNMRPREQWSFAAVEPLFDYLREATGTRVKTYGIYGHSAGAQYLHRFLTLVPEARFDHMILANAGWYTMPDLAVAYPYGLGGVPVDRAGLAAALGKRVTVLLGTADVDPAHHQLSRTPGAMAQGPHRMARGLFYFASAKAAATSLKTRFAWDVAYAPGIGHNNKGMSAAAAPLIWKKKP